MPEPAGTPVIGAALLGLVAAAPGGAGTMPADPFNRGGRIGERKSRDVVR